MICYLCGNEAGKAEVCPSCGADLHIFQKVIRISNAYYNDGLSKAEVRNLSGAIQSLKACLKFNKYHIDARNLLGLVYYETGETVAALSEWVISRNYQSQDNRATLYLEDVRKNQSQLNAINQTIKKYNQALQYCRQDSRDLAVIQLKKVLSLNPNLVKGHQLLALLYIQDGKYELAKKTLRAAGKIDTDNTTTLRYLKEVNARLRENTPKKKDTPNDDLISYQSGNETIIMPKRFKESSLGSTILSIVIGLVIGAAVTAWLFIPQVKQQAVNDANQQMLAANDTISTNNQTISELERQVEQLQAQIDSVEDNSEEVQTQIDAYEGLLSACSLYISGDITGAGTAIAEVDKASLSKSAKKIYKSIKASVDEVYIQERYEEGTALYNSQDYENAAIALQEVADSNIDYDSGMCAYNLAQSYRKIGETELAVPYYQYILDNYPGTKRAKTAKNYVN
jgi:tetratricopeptide (TPR) repeat protein